MSEFLLVLLFTLCLVSGFVLLQVWLRVPRYRLEREDFRELLTDALEGRARIERWEMIVGMPVRHDEQLEGWRTRLARLADAGRPGTRLENGTSYCRFRPEETEILQRILQEMDCAERGIARRRF